MSVIFIINPLAEVMNMDIGIIVLIAVSAFGTGMGGIPLLRLGRRRYNALEFVLFCLRIAAVLAAAAVCFVIGEGPFGSDQSIMPITLSSKSSSRRINSSGRCTSEYSIGDPNAARASSFPAQRLVAQYSGMNRIMYFAICLSTPLSE